MAIRPPSDLVMDVASRADPTRYASAVAKLGGDDATDSFSAVLRGAAPRTITGMSSISALAMRDSARGPLVKRASDSSGSMQGLEEVLMTRLVEAMMPQRADSVFGKGFAGSVWKSMMAEKIAHEIVRANAFSFSARTSLQRYQPLPSADASAFRAEQAG